MNPILHIYQTPLESYQEASNYYRVVISGILFTFMYNAIANILREWEIPKIRCILLLSLQELILF